MMRSMYTAVTGLSSHRTAMDVVGNNLANVNTVGFKKGRAFFQDLFSQTLVSPTAATATTPARNPVQVGLGVRVASIDNIFTQGAFETTGRTTDLAISGKGFFVVRHGNGYYYTRAGNFSFNSDGYLVDPNGYVVQGYKFNEQTGEWEPLASDVLVDPSDRLAPKQTDILKLKVNLSANAHGYTYETWSIGPFRNSASATVSTISAAHTYIITDSCMAEAITDGDYLDILATGHDGQAITGRFYFNESGTSVSITTSAGSTTVGYASSAVTLTAGSTINDITPGKYLIVLQSDNANYQVGQIVRTDDLLGQSITGQVTLRVAGTYEDLFLYLNYMFNRGATNYSSSVTFDTATWTLSQPYTTMGDYQIRFEDGLIKVIDKICGDSLMSIRLNFVDYGASGSKLDVPEVRQEVEGKDADKHVVVSKIYDKFGVEHELKITYVKVQGEDADDNASFFSASSTDDPNQRKNVWLFYTELDGQYLQVNGATGRVVFDSNGNPTVYYYYAHYQGGNNQVGAFDSITAIGTITDPQQLPICPSENCPVVFNVDVDGDGIVSSVGMTIATLNEYGAALGIHLEEWNSELFGGPVSLQTREEDGRLLLTSVGGDSTTYYVEQNGYPGGDLVSLEIGEGGVVQAVYTNGQTRQKYRIALAGFTNEQGLRKLGDNLFAESPSSGPPIVGASGEKGLGIIKAGVLEMSNVDIAEEFTKMILIQRGFQANARVITTSDEMLQDIIALKR